MPTKLTYNPYTGTLRDIQREYKKLWEKRPLTPDDIKKLEELNRRLITLHSLVSLYSLGGINDR